MREENLRLKILPLFDERDRQYAAWYLDNWLKCYSPISGMYEIAAEIKEEGWLLYILSDFLLRFAELTNCFPELYVLINDLAVSYDCQAMKGDKGCLRIFS